MEKFDEEETARMQAKLERASSASKTSSSRCSRSKSSPDRQENGMIPGMSDLAKAA